MPTAAELPPVEVDVDHHDDAVTVVPRGDLDVAGGPRLADALAEAEAGRGDVRVDLSAVGFVDSAGLRALLRSQRRLERSQRSLRLVHVDERLRRLLAITGLSERLLA